MDPLSVASAIAGLITLSGKVIEQGYSFLRTVDGAPRSLRALFSETAAINTVLDQIQALVADSVTCKNHSKSSSNPALEGLVRLNAISDCESLLKSINGALTRYHQVDGEKVKNAGKRVLWSFQEREVKEMLARLSSLREIFTTALSVDTAGTIQRIEKRVGDIATDNEDSKRRRILLDQKVDDIRDNQWRAQKEADEKHRAKRREKILQWLSPGNFDSNRQRDIRQKRAIGSGAWFFSTHEWNQWVSGESKLFWCRGNAGTGKTVLMSTVRDYLEENRYSRGAGIAHIYFDYNDRENQTLERILARILKQLASQQTQLHQQIEAFYEGNSKDLLSADDLRASILILVREFRHVYILLDALDECVEGTRREHILAAVNYLGQQSESIQFFVTSRPHLGSLEPFSGPVIRFELSATASDIELLVRNRLREDKSMSAEFVEEVLRRLSISAQGMMLFVTFQLEYILKQPNNRKKREALNTIPTDINKIYDRAFATINDQIDSCRELAFRTLSWIQYAFRPLKVKELQVAVAIEEENTRLDRDAITSADILVEVCAGLVVIDEANGTVRLSHYTVEEYLRDFPRRDGLSKRQVGEALLTYLSFDWFDKDSPNCPTEAALKERLEMNHLLEYAAKNWSLCLSNYLCNCGNTLCDELLYKVNHLLESGPRVKAMIQVVLGGTEHTTYGYCFKPDSPFNQLHAAAIWGLDTLIERYFEGSRYYDESRYLDGNKTDPNDRDDRGRTPLSWAAEYGWVKVVKLFISREDVEVDAVDQAGRSALWWAARRNQVQCLRLFEKANHDLKDLNQRTPLLRAAMKGAEDCVEALLEWPDVDPTSVDRQGRTPLWWACRNGRTEVVRLLLDSNRVAPDVEDEFGQTPLMRACIRGIESIVKMLLERGVDINRRDGQGMTALSWVARAAWSGSGHEMVAVMLLELDGIDVTSADSNGRTALMWAEKKGNEDIARRIRARVLNLGVVQTFQANRSIEGSDGS